MDREEYERRLRRRKARSNAHHPLLNPTNSMTWRFIPGFLLGYGLSWWLNKTRRRTATEAQEGEPGDPAVEKQRAPPPEEELKMVFVVNEALKMTKGKIAAQCGHAVYGLTKKLRKHGYGPLLEQWEMCGQAKIALRGDGGVPQMNELAQHAVREDVPFHVVFDAGRTQIAAGSQTVLALGPAGKTTLDRITGHMKLL